MPFVAITVDIPRQEEYTEADLGGLPGRVRDGVMVLDTDLTVEQALDLYAEDPHVQLIEGRLVVSPMPTRFHQRVMLQLAVWLDAQLPGGWSAVPAPNVAVSGKGLPIPDIAVTRTGPDSVAVPATEVALVVEILSPKTRRYDQGEKLAMWLAAVPCVWLVDPQSGDWSEHRSPTIAGALELSRPPLAVLTVG